MLPARGLERPGVFEAIAACGFRSLELSGDGNAPDRWMDDPADARRRLDALGLAAAAVHTPSAGWHNSAADTRTRESSVRACCESLAWALEIGAGLVIVHPNAPDMDGNAGDFDVARHLGRESVARIAEEAGRLGLRIAVENMPRREHIHLPGTAMAEVLELIEGLGEHVGVCLDTGHSNINGLSAADEVDAAGGRLFSVHLHDNDGTGDQHAVPGEGTVDWTALGKALAGSRAGPLLTIEVRRKPQGLEATLAALAAVRDSWEEE